MGYGKLLDSNGTKLALDVKVGDRVPFGRYSGTEITVGGEDVLIVRSRDARRRPLRSLAPRRTRSGS